MRKIVSIMFLIIFSSFTLINAENSLSVEIVGVVDEPTEYIESKSDPNEPLFTAYLVAETPSRADFVICPSVSNWYLEASISEPTVFDSIVTPSHSECYLIEIRNLDFKQEILLFFNLVDDGFNLQYQIEWQYTALDKLQPFDESVGVLATITTFLVNLFIGVFSPNEGILSILYNADGITFLGFIVSVLVGAMILGFGLRYIIKWLWFDEKD